MKKNQKKTKKFFWQKPNFWEFSGMGLLVLFAGVVAYASGQFLGAGLWQYLEKSLDGFQEIEQLFVQYLLMHAVVLVLLFAVAFLFRANWKELGLGKVKNWNYFWLLPVIFIITIVVSAVATVVVALFIPEYNPGQKQELGLPDVGQGDLLIMGIFLALVVPLVEEFIFRGWLFGLLRRYSTFWPATLITSVIFGAAHGQWNVAINTFILSLALCYMREKTGSIWAGVALHSLKNFIAFLLLFVYNLGL